MQGPTRGIEGAVPAGGAADEAAGHDLDGAARPAVLLGRARPPRRAQQAVGAGRRRQDGDGVSIHLQATGEVVRVGDVQHDRALCAGWDACAAGGMR